MKHNKPIFIIKPCTCGRCNDIFTRTGKTTWYSIKVGDKKWCYSDSISDYDLWDTEEERNSEEALEFFTEKLKDQGEVRLFDYECTMKRILTSIHFRYIHFSYNVKSWFRRKLGFKK